MNFKQGRRDFIRMIGQGSIAAFGLFGLSAVEAAERVANGTSSEKSQNSGMPIRRLGKTNHYSSVVGFGGVAAAKMSIDETKKAIDEAIELGINYVDVAPSYGDAEVKIGEAMKSRRKDVFLACKTLKRSREEAKQELHKSLKTLNTEVLDLYQLHAVDKEDDLEQIFGPDGAMETIREAQKTGFIRFIGITGHRPEIQVKALKMFDFDTVMIPVDFIDRFITGAEFGLLPLAEKKDVGVIAIKSTMRGATKDKENAYRYTLSQRVSMTIPAGDFKEIKLAAEVARSFKPMDMSELQAFLRDSPELGDIYCRQCFYCMPCGQDIDIPLLFRIEGYFNRYNEALARSQYAQLKVKASACDGCKTCEEKCPYQIPIVNRLKDIASKLG